MTIRIFALSVFLLPAAALPTALSAQQSTYPGECDHARACPAGQIMDTAKKTCVEVSA